MAVSEEQKRSNTKAMNQYMGAAVGLASAYTAGYAGSIAASAGTGFLDSLPVVLENLRSLQFFYMPSALSFLGFGAGAVIGAAVYGALQVSSEQNYSYTKDAVAGTGGFMSAEEKKGYDKKFVATEVYKDPLTHKEMPNCSPNMILCKGYYRSMSDFFTRRNNNVLIIGGAGTGKSRFFIKPNILQMNASYVVTDPSGEIVTSLGNVLKDNGYKIKIFNISEMSRSNCYNPFRYIRDENGVLMLVECLIKNTNRGDGGKGDNQFFEDAERLLYTACIFHLINFEPDITLQTFTQVFEMINMSEVDENNAAKKSKLDELFEMDPENSLARKYYRAFKQAAGKTLKSIIISCVVRLQPFQLPKVKNLTKIDEMELEKLGDEKTAIFIITPQADRTFAFLASMLYSQLFETLYFKGEQQKLETGSERLTYPVRCLMDEFANSVTRSTPKAVGITDKSVA